MALTITQANQVNVLLDWLLNNRGHGGNHPDLQPAVSFDDARHAAIALAGAASKSLGAGLSESKVAELWDQQNKSGALRRKRNKGANHAI